MLKEIDDPSALRLLTEAEILGIANELREYIIAVVSRNGGHLASNLGVVELTLALHREFDFSRDRIVWDVGHQSYAHKILTGRRDRFDSLRRQGGLSGFPKRAESVYDAFDTGHATTSISAALGLAEADRHNDKKSAVVAVIGDGALTGGLAWEAINHAAHLNRPLIVILNDNEMSIARNVGAISRYLSTLRTTGVYRKTKHDVEGALKNTGRWGSFVWRTATRLKDSLKYLLMGGVVFEELGFTYLGPVDGHSIADLQAVLKQAKQLDEPVLVHCLTQKGRGYAPASHQPDQYHSAAPFHIETGMRLDHGNANITFTSAFGGALAQLGSEDERIIAVTAAMLEGTGLPEFASRFPTRLYDVGIAEPHALTFAAGLAAGGMKPVVAMYSTFMQRGFDQLVHDICLQQLPVVVCLDRAGAVGEDGETHQGIYDLSFLRSAPGVTIFAPSGQDDMLGLLRRAIALEKPAVLRYPRDKAKTLSIELPEDGKFFFDDAPDVCLIGIGPLFMECMAAAEQLRSFGIKVGVRYCPQVWPLEQELVELIRRMSLVVTVEDNVLAGGFGSSMAEAVSSLPVRVVRLGFVDGFVAQAARSVQLAQAGLTAEGIVKAVLDARK